MDSTFLITLILIIIPTLILILFQIFKTQNSNLPPGNTGWPILGETLAFATNPEKFIRDRMTKNSLEIFKTSIVGEKMVVVCGPLANKFIFHNTKLFPTWWPISVSKSMYIHDSLYQKYINIQYLRDHSFLKVDSMKNYVPIIDSMAKEHMDLKWEGINEVKVHPLSKYFTFALACRIFINLDDPTRVQDLAEPFFAVAKRILSAPMSLRTQFSQTVKGGKVIREKFLEVVKQRKAELAETRGDCEPKDLLGRSLLRCDENGKFLDEDVIVVKIIGYLVAAFHTTSNAITFLLSHLAEHPDVYDKVLEEQTKIAKSKGDGEMLTWADVQKMRYSWNVVLESMRLIPPGQGGFKNVLEGFSFGGFHIPKGWKVLWSVHSTHKDPKYFSDPEKFDPSRFEGSGPPPFTFVPFGGGPRMCAGKEFARIEILVYLHNVVTRFKLKKTNSNEKIIYNTESTPSQGLRMCLQPHRKI